LNVAKESSPPFAPDSVVLLLWEQGHALGALIGISLSSFAICFIDEL
jgi:hypothetical protein